MTASSPHAALRLWTRMITLRADDRLSVGLAVIGFAVATAAALTTVGGARALIVRDGDPTYTLLALAASVILVVPIAGLAGAVARLAVSRRNARLAAMRLSGATSSQVALIAVLDAVSQAVVGAATGILLYLLALPGVAMITFQGRRFTWSELWVGPGLLAAVLGGIVILATASALVALTSVVISPLGVAQRRTPARVMIIRGVIFVVVLLAWVPLTRSVAAVGLVGLIIGVGFCFLALSLVGPLVLRLIGHLAAARARSAPALVAARRLLDDPRSAWRPISGVTLATFVAGLMSVGPALSAGLEEDAATAAIGRDLLTGSAVTLVIAGLLAAASSGVTQAARVLDQREHYRLLHLAGTDLRVLRRARLYEVALPLVTSVAIAAGAACVLIAPFGLALISRAPQGLAVFGGGAAGAVLLVLTAVAVSDPLVTSVARAEVRQPS